jgi:hypothetical protein
MIGAISDLVRTGDSVRRIEGALSGTLGFLLTKIADGVASQRRPRERPATLVTRSPTRARIWPASTSPGRF